MKGEKWPPGGYVDPCSTPRAADPASFFEFDFLTAEILPKRGLIATCRNRAKRTIEDFKLNLLVHHLKRRWNRIRDISEAASRVPEVAAKQKAFVEKVAGRDEPLSSFIRSFLESRGFPVEHS